MHSSLRGQESRRTVDRKKEEQIKKENSVFLFSFIRVLNVFITKSKQRFCLSYFRVSIIVVVSFVLLFIFNPLLYWTSLCFHFSPLYLFTNGVIYSVASCCQITVFSSSVSFSFKFFFTYICMYASKSRYVFACVPCVQLCLFLQLSTFSPFCLRCNTIV